MYRLCQYPNDEPQAPSASGEGLPALSHMGVIGGVEHLQKYLLEAKDTCVLVEVPGCLFYKAQLHHCPTLPPPWCGSPGSCWDASHLTATRQGLLEPSRALRQVGGYLVHCRAKVTSVHRWRHHLFGWQVIAAMHSLPQPAFPLDRVSGSVC